MTLKITAMPHIAYVFIDGGYLRHIAWDNNRPLYNPRDIAGCVVSHKDVQAWPAGPHTVSNVHLARIIYYDGRPDEPDEEEDKELTDYWDAIELLPDTELGFGSVRGRPRRQKAVDTLIAVDMLVGAFTKLFSVAVLISGDSDFVPVVDEVRRRGVMVAVAAEEESLAEDLRRAADRFVPIALSPETQSCVMKVNDRSWQPPNAK